MLAYHTREVFSSRSLVCVRLHVYVCMYACARVCMCMHACAQNTHSFSSSVLKDINTKVVHVCVSACTDVCVRVRKCVCACVRVCASVRETAHARARVRMCVCIQNTHNFSSRALKYLNTRAVHIYAYVYTRVCVNICVFVRLCVFVYMQETARVSACARGRVCV